jgi:hypothetical protein
MSSAVMERRGAFATGAAPAFPGNAPAAATPNVCVVPRCELKFEKCKGGFRIQCNCDNAAACNTLRRQQVLRDAPGLLRLPRNLLQERLLLLRLLRQHLLLLRNVRSLVFKRNSVLENRINLRPTSSVTSSAQACDSTSRACVFYALTPPV